MSKYSEGLWEVEGKLVVSTQCDEQGVFVEVIAHAHREANARLIAAGPELLEALEACQRELRKLSFKDDGITHALERAASAIAKAKGE